MKIQRGYFFASSATQKATLIVSQPICFRKKTYAAAVSVRLREKKRGEDTGQARLRYSLKNMMTMVTTTIMINVIMYVFVFGGEMARA